MPMKNTYESFSPKEVTLGDGLFRARHALNRAYVMSLKPDNLLQNHYLEAGLRSWALGSAAGADEHHWGWESPTIEVRGHFLGHWLSAAAHLIATGDDPELKARAGHVVAELAQCQERNGGEWVFSIPEKYLRWTAEGKPTWAAQYVAHKTLMGLLDMYAVAGNRTALEIVERAARWFHRWTAPFSREKMDDILDVETGGILEVWADLYAHTKAPEHLDLIERYTRNRLFAPLLEGRDVLTGKHANTTVPEIHGAARAYEVTGDERWRRIVEAYWISAVDKRGTFATGGQTSDELWTPPFEYAGRRGDSNQEHCVVFNMIRLADRLFRWTGDVKYADYIERNLYNGILAQQNPRTGMVAYFLPLGAGAQKAWGTPTYNFWCCHGTMVQAHAFHNAWIHYRGQGEIIVCQYIASTLRTEIGGRPVTIDLTLDQQPPGAVAVSLGAAGSGHRPDRAVVRLSVNSAEPMEFGIKLRIPWWAKGKPTVTINGETQTVPADRPCFFTLTRRWHKDAIQLDLPKGLTVCEIPDEPDTVAFLDGPVVLAGLCDRETTLLGDKTQPDTILKPDNEWRRKWRTWLAYRTVGQLFGIRFRPLHEIVDERYTVYFPLRPH